MVSLHQDSRDTTTRPLPLTRSKNYANLTVAFQNNDNITAQSELSTHDVVVSAQSPTSSQSYAQSEPTETTYHYINYSQLGEIETNQQMAASELQQGDSNDAAIAANHHEHNCENKIFILRQLLAVERASNDRRRQNNRDIQEYLEQLQSDYLKLQQELVECLQLNQQIKAQKEAQLQLVSATVREKDSLINQLQKNLDHQADNHVREEFEKTMINQKQLFHIEKQQLLDQIRTFEQECSSEREKNLRLVQQHESQLTDMHLRHHQEVQMLTEKQNQLQDEIEQLHNEPKSLIINSLRNENSRLSLDLEQTTSELNGSRSRYESMKERVEDLVSQQESMEAKFVEDMEKVEERYLGQRQKVAELEMKLVYKNEVMQATQFDLDRSETRVKNLLLALKNKELAHHEMVNELQMKHAQEVDKLASDKRALEKKSLDLEGELDRKQNETIRLELEQVNHVDSIKNDRDLRINKLVQERQRLQYELQFAELRLAKEVTGREQLDETVQELQRETTQLREEIKSLSMKLATTEAQIYSKQQAIKSLREERGRVQDFANLEESQLALELESERRRSRRLKETVDQLEKDCQKLNRKLKISEANLGKISASFNKYLMYTPK